MSLEHDAPNCPISRPNVHDRASAVKVMVSARAAEDRLPFVVPVVAGWASGSPDRLTDSKVTSPKPY